MSESGAGLKAAFRAKWATMGRSLLSIYGPVDGWTLGAGVVYDPGQDRFEDGDGTAVVVDYATAATITTARYVPVTKSEAPIVDVGDSKDFDQPGLLLRVEYSADVVGALVDTWAINVGGTLYRQTTQRLRYLPLGATVPVLFEIELFSVWGNDSETIAIRRGAATLAAQTVRIARQGGNATRADGGNTEQFSQRVVVMGTTGLDIAIGDRFNDGRGQLYEVDFVRPSRRVMTVAEARMIQ